MLLRSPARRVKNIQFQLVLIFLLLCANLLSSCGFRDNGIKPCITSICDGFERRRKRLSRLFSTSCLRRVSYHCSSFYYSAGCHLRSLLPRKRELHNQCQLPVALCKELGLHLFHRKMDSGIENSLSVLCFYIKKKAKR